MTALDVYAAGGYFTYVLSKAVGPEGTVLAQNSPRALRFDEDRSDITQGDALAQKIESGTLNNVVRIDRPVDDDTAQSEALARQAQPGLPVMMVPAFTGLGAPWWDGEDIAPDESGESEWDTIWHWVQEVWLRQ